MIQYSLEVGLSWLFFYLLYVLLLRKETFFKFNRIYLIGTLVLGLLIPKISEINYSFSNTESAEILPTLIQPITVTAQKLSYSLETIVVTAEKATAFNIWKFIFSIWAIGSLLACFRFLFGLFKLSKLALTNPTKYLNGYKIVYTNAPHLPFSFLNILFWSDFYLEEEREKMRIFDHELVHIRKAHSLDNIFVALLLIPFWWVLPLYGYRKAIKTIHEYEADEVVTLDTPVPEYGRLLMQYARNGFQLPLTNSFAFTQLKNRIVMMTQKKSNPKKLWKYIMVLPIAFVLCVFLANTNPFAAVPNSAGLNKAAIINVTSPDPFDRIQIKKELTALYELDHKDKSSNFVNYNKRIEDLKKQYPEQSQELDSLSFEIFKEFALINNKDGYKVAKYEIKDGCVVESNKIKSNSASVPGDIYKVVDVMPRFTECTNKGSDNEFDCAQQKMLEFIYTNIKYPATARDNGVEGIVVCRFIVDKDGNVIQPEIVRSLGSGCDTEVLRIVNSFPQWQPGVQAGKKVNVYYNLPVKFKLQDDVVEETPVEIEIAERARISGCEKITDKDERFSCAQRKLMTEIFSNIKYPELARENGIEGVSILRFDVEQNGTLSNPGFKKFIGGNCEEAVLDMFDHLKNNTTWIPAKTANGKSIKSEYILPVKFKLESKDLPDERVIPLELSNYNLFPNPTVDEINIVFNPKVAQNIRMEIYDVSGKQIKSMELGMIDGQNRYKVDATNWDSGMYFLKLIGPTEVFIDQFQVIK